MWGSGMAPPQKEVWGVKLEIVGACHVAPSLEALDTCQKDRSGRSRLCHLRGIQILLFLQERRGWHVAPPQSGSTLPCGRRTGMEEAECATSEGGLFYFFWCREVWTCVRQVSAVWRSLLKWRHLRRRFEFQMGVGPGGMEDGHVAVPQSGSYNAMWQEGKARNMWRPHIQSRKSRIQDLRHLGLVWKFLNGCFFWRRPRVTRVLYFFWRKLEMTCVIYFSEKK